MSEHKTLIMKLKSQVRKQRNLLKLCSPEMVKSYLENIETFKNEIERISKENTTLKKEVFIYKSREQAFGKKSIFRKFWEVLKNGK